MATVQILGTGCSKCTHLFKNAEDAVQARGRGDRVEKIEDIVRILDFSPSALPAMAIDGKVVYSFSRTPLTEGDSINVTWYDGAARPPAEVIALLEGKEFPDQGTIFIGTEGVMVLPHVSRLQLFPLEKFKDYISAWWMM